MVPNRATHHKYAMPLGEVNSNIITIMRMAITTVIRTLEQRL